ncbi:hypothetical protein PFISCL1PPCAC_24519, partial [Pristionchus fissidentatus]
SFQPLSYTLLAFTLITSIHQVPQFFIAAKTCFDLPLDVFRFDEVKGWNFMILVLTAHSLITMPASFCTIIVTLYEKTSGLSFFLKLLFVYSIVLWICVAVDLGYIATTLYHWHTLPSAFPSVEEEKEADDIENFLLVLFGILSVMLGMAIVLDVVRQALHDFYEIVKMEWNH